MYLKKEIILQFYHVTSTKEITVALQYADETLNEEPYDFQINRSHSLDLFKRLMHVNALMTFNITRLVVSLMAANVPDENNQRDFIINISSILAYDAPGYSVAYAATRAAVAGMTTPLARAFGPQGICMATVAPGFVDTPMSGT